jgi:alkylhydroperoxidase family enzyme
VDRVSWLGDASDRRGVLALRPALADKHQALLAAIWSSGVSPVTLELCRIRLAMLLRAEAALAERSPAAVEAGLVEGTVAMLPDWPSDPRFSEEQAACLELTELFAIDHHAVGDEHVARVDRALGHRGTVVLLTALGVWEAQHRFDNALGVTQP